MKNADDATIAESSASDKTKRRYHHAYLLRCWQDGEAAVTRAPRWRFSLEEILHERRRKGFDSLEALLAFLRAELTGHIDQNSELPETPEF